MDLNSLDFGAAADNGFDVLLTVPPTNSEEELLHDFVGEPLEHDGIRMFVTVAGKDSKIFRKGQSKLNRIIAQMAGNQKKLAEYTVGERAQEDAIARLAACTLGGKLFANGEWVELTKDNVSQYYKKHDWLMHQVNKGIADRGNLDLDAKKN